MAYLIEAGLLLMTLLFGILGVRTLTVRGRANHEVIAKHLAIQWQDMKGPLPPATYGMSFIFLIIAFASMLGFIIAVTVLK